MDLGSHGAQIRQAKGPIPKISKYFRPGEVYNVMLVSVFGLVGVMRLPTARFTPAAASGLSPTVYPDTQHGFEDFTTTDVAHVHCLDANSAMRYQRMQGLIVGTKTIYAKRKLIPIGGGWLPHPSALHLPRQVRAASC